MDNPRRKLKKFKRESKKSIRKCSAFDDKGCKPKSRSNEPQKRDKGKPNRKEHDLSKGTSYTVKSTYKTTPKDNPGSGDRVDTIYDEAGATFKDGKKVEGTEWHGERTTVRGEKESTKGSDQKSSKPKLATKEVVQYKRKPGGEKEVGMTYTKQGASKEDKGSEITVERYKNKAKAKTVDVGKRSEVLSDPEKMRKYRAKSTKGKERYGMRKGFVKKEAGYNRIRRKAKNA